MPENAQQYVDRILRNLDRDSLAIQSTTQQKLARLTENVPAVELKRRTSSDQWSVAEIVAHLTDAEIVTSYRIRKILSESGSSISAYDQNLWEANLNYQMRDPVQDVKYFGVLRDMNLALLRDLTDEQWERFGMHEERGRESLRHLARLVAGHDVNHLKQIEAILKTPRSNSLAA
jgi:hypothetical protein